MLKERREREERKRRGTRVFSGGMISLGLLVIWGLFPNLEIKAVIPEKTRCSKPWTTPKGDPSRRWLALRY